MPYLTRVDWLRVTRSRHAHPHVVAAFSLHEDEREAQRFIKKHQMQIQEAKNPPEVFLAPGAVITYFEVPHVVFARIVDHEEPVFFEGETEEERDAQLQLFAQTAKTSASLEANAQLAALPPAVVDESDLEEG